MKIRRQNENVKRHESRSDKAILKKRMKRPKWGFNNLRRRENRKAKNPSGAKENDSSAQDVRKSERALNRLYVKKIRNHIANAITLTNLALGCASIICSFNDKYAFSIAFIGFAGVGDRLDGRVARRMGTESPLGVQLDSMSDAVSFGVAPSMLIYSIFHEKYQGCFMHTVLILSCIIFIICGLFRLARYNVNGLDEDGNFYGLPITAAGMLLALSCIIYKSLAVYWYPVLMIALALLMISKLRIKKT